MSRREEENRAFYDLVYDEWKRGHNSDDVSWDRFDSYLAKGYYPDEITVDMMCPHKHRHEEDEGGAA